MENENTNVTVTETEDAGTETQGQGTEGKMYSQDEVDRMIQAETDRRITSALKKQEKKNAEKMREAEKLAAMNEEEKYQYQLDQREKAIAQKEHELAMAENKAVAMGILADKGLSSSLVQFVVAEDAEDMKANIDLLDRAFKISVRAEVEKRLSNTNPKRSIDTKTASAEEFKKMSLNDQQKLFETDPDLYKAMFQR